MTAIVTVTDGFGTVYGSFSIVPDPKDGWGPQLLQQHAALVRYIQDALEGTRRLGNPNLARCNPETGEHSMPHVGCILR